MEKSQSGISDIWIKMSFFDERRKMAIDGYIIQLDYSAIKEQTAEIQKVGVNVNQIARRVNSTGNAYKEDLEEIKGALEKIWQLQRYTLSKLR